MIRVRDAEPSDAEAWRAIVLEAAHEARQIVTYPEEVWSAEQLVEKLAGLGEALAFLVAEAEGRVVGVLGLVRGPRPATRHTAELGLTVARAWRGRGVGTALMRAAQERARAWGATKLCLGVFADNDGARRLYARLGYEAEGTRRRHYLVGGVLRDEVLMAKWLEGAP